MNSKKTNYFVALLNAVSIVAFYIFVFSANYISSSIMTGVEAGKSIYNNVIIDFLLNKIQIVFTILNGGLGILNIICAIQNRKDRKISFWFGLFGIYKIWITATVSILLNSDDILEWGNRILFGIIPIIFALKNIIFIRKTKPKRIHIISYILVIIISIIHLIYTNIEFWNIVIVIMQLIYIHNQQKSDLMNKKIINVFLYYILQTAVVVGFLFMVVYSILVTKINDSIWKKELLELNNKIVNMQQISNKELYIPVMKNDKYGFINKSGKEKIACQYDRVTFFYEIELNNVKCYVAFAKRDNKYYMISKSNDSIMLEDNLQTYMQTIDNYICKTMDETVNEDGDYRRGYVWSYQFLFSVLTRGELEYTTQTIEKSEYRKIDLKEKNSIYYCENENYSIMIEPIYDETNIEEFEYSYGKYLYSSLDENKYKLTITKNDGEKNSYIEYLPRFRRG